MRNIVIWIKNSVNVSDELRNYFRRENIAEGNMKKVILDVATRWNSTFYMLKRFVELAVAIRHVLLSCTNPPDAVNAGEIEIIVDVLQVLEPLEKMTVEFSAEQYVTLSKVIPILKFAYHYYSRLSLTASVGKVLKENILPEMNKRFSTSEHHFLLASPTLLDPRFKNLHFEDPVAVSTLFRHIRKMILSAAAPTEESGSSGTDSPVADILWAHHTSIAHKSKKDTTTNDELTRYLDVPVMTLSQDPIAAWYELKSVYPHIYSVAEKCLTIPATSVPSERLFSKAGDIITKKGIA